MLEKWKYKLHPLLDLIYPNLCIACDNEKSIDNSCFCLTCMDDLPFTEFLNERDNMVEKYFWGRLEVKKATSLFYFHKGEVVQEMLHRLKYKNEAYIGKALGIHYGDKLVDTNFLDGIDLIIPIPIHKSKKRIRNYNQCELIAKGISSVSGIPTSNKVLVKYTQTTSQTDKTREERLNNLKNTFRVENISLIKDKNILIVDDILTTGATLEAVGSLLAEYESTINIAVLAVGKY